MRFSEFKYRRLYAAWMLRKWWVLLMLVLPFALIGMLGFYVHGPGRQIVDVTPGTLLRTTRVPENGYYGSAATPWLVEVQLASGEKVIAEFPLLPRPGERVCVVQSSVPLVGSVYEVSGYIDAMAARGRTCGDTVPGR